MSGVNKAIIVGRLGKDPESKKVNGQTCTRLSVATSRVYTERAGQSVEDTEWHHVTAWGPMADNAQRYLFKGREVYVEGRLRTYKYTKDGQDHYATEIVAEAIQYLGSGRDKETGK